MEFVKRKLLKKEKKMSEQKVFKMSEQFKKAIMLAFNKTILEPGVSSIGDIMGNFEIVDTDGGLIVLNPPVYKINEEMLQKLMDEYGKEK